MVKLTTEEQALLFDIVNDKYSVGAFSGMVFNAYLEKQSDQEKGTELIDKIIKTALYTRLRVKQLATQPVQ